MMIQYFHDTWTRGHVLSRGGKASTASWHFMNIKDLDSEQANCVSMKDMEWMPGEDAEDVLFNEDGMKRFSSAKCEEIQKWKEMDAYEAVDDTGQTPCISSRWVCTEKENGLVAIGFEEHNPQIKT